MVSAKQSIREIVTAAPSAEAVLERFDIDLCTQADVELERVCTELQLSVGQVLEKLADAEAVDHGIVALEVETYSLERLIQHIVRTHHQTVRRELPRLVELSQRLARKHDKHTPHHQAMADLMAQLRDAMFEHLEKEEMVLFPHVVRLEEASEDCTARSYACFRSVAQPIAVMVREHDAAREMLEELSKLTNGFESPEGACPKSIAFHAGLATFEKDLKQHVHLETDLLFPRAIDLETQLTKEN